MPASKALLGIVHVNGNRVSVKFKKDSSPLTLTEMQNICKTMEIIRELAKKSILDQNDITQSTYI